MKTVIKAKEQAHFKRYVREVAKAIGLDHWIFWFIFDPELDATMRVNYKTEYIEATFTVNDALLRDQSFDTDDVRRVVTHELIHLHHGHVEDRLDALVSNLGTEARNLLQETQVRECEQHVETMARLIAPQMPEYVPFKNRKN